MVLIAEGKKSLRINIGMADDSKAQVCLNLNQAVKEWNVIPKRLDSGRRPIIYNAVIGNFFASHF